MGFYSDFLDRNLSFEELTQERKKCLKKISELRNNHDILVYAVDINKRAPISIDYSDIIPFTDMLSNLNGTDSIDIILQTPGGMADIVQKFVTAIRDKYKNVSIIVPGIAMSAGTIFAMSANEILMGKTSSLGPIDAQINSNGKQYSAEAFISGLEKIKEEIERTGKLNPVYIPILQNITPGELQEYENAQELSRSLVKNWLVKYKFSNWTKHSKTNEKVTEEEKISKAEEIAKKLGNHSRWLTHSRPLGISELREMGLQITDYTENKELDEYITKYFILLSMMFDISSIYKIYETSEKQILRSISPQTIPINSPVQQTEHKFLNINFVCPRCQNQIKLQGNLDPKTPIINGALPFPKNNILVCPYCNMQSNLQKIRMDVESKIKHKIF